MRRCALASALACAGLLAATAPAGAATITVTTNDDTSASECTLRDAIDAANSDSAAGACSAGSGADALAIEPAGTLTLGSALPSIVTEMTLVGLNGMTVDGNGGSRVFTVNSGTSVSISGLAVTGGSAPAGGGIHHEGGGSLTLSQMVVTGNAASVVTGSGWADARGGGIYNGTGSSLTILDSAITDNTLTSTATGANNFGLAYGSGIASRGPVEIERSKISSNDTVISSEHYTQGAGGIWSSGAVRISHSAVTENTITATTTAGSGNSVPAGAGISIEAATAADTLTLDTVTVAGNTQAATGSPPGSGVERGGGINLVGAGGTIESSTIAQNDANYDGANVILNASGETLTFENTIVADAMGGSQNCSDGNGTFSSLGHNLEDDADPANICRFTTASDISATDPQLGTPAENGGPTPTLLPDPSSPVIDAGLSTASDSDQRGQTRPRDLIGTANALGGDGADIGAYERQTTERDVSSIDFGAQQAGTSSAPQTARITNATGSLLNVSASALTGDADDFDIVSDGCGVSLSPGGFCDVSVAFAPATGATPGSKTADLEVGDAGSASPLVVHLSGLATAGPAQPAAPVTTPQAKTKKKKCKKGRKLKKGKCVKKRKRRGGR